MSSSVRVSCPRIPCESFIPKHLVLLGSPATFFREKSGSSLLLTYTDPLKETRLLVHFLLSTLQERRSRKTEQLKGT
ncbi:hypothetical protein SCLCIDRAFT_1225359 [Scleroderma citrinum Foug A]|uniref:Uncharacterized protein n=1 Tax=Scleroderma citrinum Foug A TaxID=1036808 RepID=A0A0C3D1X9_9AGAM|nr:hypothetical protein SCLCIDRAFT_1225359 [Scleroderma citrinum Foug A]